MEKGKSMDDEMNLANDMTGLGMVADKAMRGDRNAGKALAAYDADLTCASAVSGLYAMREMAAGGSLEALEHLHACAETVHNRMRKLAGSQLEALEEAEREKRFRRDRHQDGN